MKQVALNGKSKDSERAALEHEQREDADCGKRSTARAAARTDLANAEDDTLETFLCPVDEAARIVGQKWTLQIVHHLLDGHTRRFCELQEALGKVNPSTLSSRLKMLEEAGLVTRRQISDIPPHVEYGLTEMGAQLRGVINEITRWSNTHLCGVPSARSSAQRGTRKQGPPQPTRQPARQPARRDPVTEVDAESRSEPVPAPVATPSV